MAICSFGPGSSGRLDGLHPQHIRDMLDASPLVKSRRPGSPRFYKFHTFWGYSYRGKACVLWGDVARSGKGVWGVRPIAVGMTLLRLVSKVANVSAIHRGAHLLSLLS